jgi:tRNA threonylcarbamoyladenosine biosynthesis protein TsaE
MNMKELLVVTKTRKETQDLACRLGEIVEPNTLITLSGDLGAGKTTFTQGLARGLGIEKKVTSPTFTIMKEYRGRLPLYHIDAYRLENITQDLGFDEYIESDGVCVIEWADFIEYVLPEELLNIEFTINDDDSRTLKLKAYGERYEEVIAELCTR